MATHEEIAPDEGDEEGADALPDVQTGSIKTSPLLAAFVDLREESRKAHERLLRTAADFENYKRRARRDLEDAVRRAEENVVLRFLPIVDNLERAISHGSEHGEATGPKSVIDGVQMVQKQFLAALAQYGVEPFDSVGEPFNPELHEAIQQQSAEEPRNTIVHEVQKGYRRKGRLVRPAMVVVSLGPESSSEDGAPDAAAGRDDANESG